nr:MAG TPA: hypothetical protein [Caudoviricetes sp.]
MTPPRTDVFKTQALATEHMQARQADTDAKAWRPNDTAPDGRL